MEDANSECSASRIKAPVPLPRTKLLDNADMVSDNSDRISTESSEKSDKEDSHVHRSLTRSSSALRKSLRIVSNVQEKGSAVIENTKLVGAKIEKSMRNMLKRHSTASAPETNNSETGNICSDDCSVFNDIKFGSPIVNEERSLPPPYPPPPLPYDCYDEISSTKSSTSESHYSYPASVTKESYYEEIPFMKDVTPKTSQESDSESSSHSGIKNKSSRSDSWDYITVENVSKESEDSNQVVSNADSQSSTSDSSRMCTETCDVLHSYENFIPARISKQTNVYSDNPVKPGPKSVTSLGSVESAQSIVNSVYENWGPIVGEDLTPLENRDKTKSLLLHSDAPTAVICEFDPLFKENDPLFKANPILQQVYESRMKYLEHSRSLNMWDEESVKSKDVWSTDVESVAEDTIYELASNCSEKLMEMVEEGEEVTVDEDVLPPDLSARKKVVRWSSMKKAMQKVKDLRKRPAEASVVPKPKEILPSKPPSELPTLVHSGYLYKSGAMMELPKHLSKKWCQLGEGKISFSSDKNMPAKDSIILDNIYSIQLISDSKLSECNELVHCWEIIHAKGKSCIVGSSAPTERRIWMQKILESLTQCFPTLLTSTYTRAGWVQLRESIGGQWNIAWLLLQKRTLHYSLGKGKNFEVDLRKIMKIELKTGEEGDQVVMDMQDQSIRLQVNKDLKSWMKVIKAAAVDNGTSLSEQQLTKDNIPTIVTKCVSFIYAHGCMSEGIYRRSGSNANIQKLLTDLRKDAWAVTLSKQEYSEYDVSTALKRFFRDLPDPLFTAELHDYLCNIAGIKCSKNEKVSMYRSCLEKLPVVNYVTARKLMQHLHFISQESDKNLMTVDNLAAIWAPTLMHVQDNENSKWNKQEWQVVQDLMTLYRAVFLVAESEVAIERRIQEVLEKVHLQGGPNHHQPSGDLKIWVYIGSRDNGSCINVTVDPDRRAGEMVSELCTKSKLLSDRYCLQEVCLSGSLVRPLHHTEKVFHTVIRWAYWHHDHRKDNHLLLTDNTIFKKIAAAIVSPPLSKCGELKFATPKMKAFKTFLFEFSQAKLSYFKDAKLNVKLGEWRIEDVVVYLGHDHRRQPQSKWTLTFIPKGYIFDTSKEYGFGYTIGGSQDDLTEWLSSFFLAQYSPTEVLPPPSTAQLIPHFTDFF